MTNTFEQVMRSYEQNLRNIASPRTGCIMRVCDEINGIEFRAIRMEHAWHIHPIRPAGVDRVIVDSVRILGELARMLDEAAA